MTEVKDWSKPTEISDVDMVFPANALEIMPSREECESGLDALDPKVRHQWIDFQRTWFFSGISDKCTVEMKEGIDGEKAFRHLQAIQGSFAPKHEHKEAAVAYLCSLWFDSVKNYKK